MNRVTTGIMAFMLALLLCTTAMASIQVDFQPNGSDTQSGFAAISSSSPTTIDGVTFQVQGAFFDRGPVFTAGGSFTYADLFDDFAYTNGNGTIAPPVMLSMSGLLANTAYSIRFYSADKFNSVAWPVDQPWAGSLTTTYTPIAGTGSVFSSAFDRTVDPTTNDQYSGLGTITSNASGEIAMRIVGSSASGTAFTRLNGLTLETAKSDALPEPGTLAIWSVLGALGIAVGWYRRKR